MIDDNQEECGQITFLEVVKSRRELFRVGRARHVATIGVVTSENSVEPFPLQALAPSEKLGSASGDDCAFLRFAGRSSIQLHGADRDSAKA